ncbi:DUF3027 domain-containing protein [Williamsia sp. CHRR-6]|nr:DUF3027 domain-containing protein [Williamsia sp. CHRR-6]MBT0566406.1 DUF3027 domain-containing protein [Williamsia sp. CHRR-6]
MQPVSADVEARLVEAVEFARAAVEADSGSDSAPSAVGGHLRADVEGDYTVSHYFEADIAGYRGWVWCAVLATSPVAPGIEPTITVSEIALLPGADAVVAPTWVPWAERIAPGDLGPGDVLAAPADDIRLVPNHIDTSYLDADEYDQVSEVALELGLGRKRLLSREGRDLAAQRWFDGDFGPDADMAAASKLACGSCGFYLPLAGGLRVAFGVCANEFAADGRVVASSYGCGAHSDVVAPSGEGSPAYDAYDDGAIEVVARPAASTEHQAAAPAAEVATDTDPETPESETPEAAELETTATDTESRVDAPAEDSEPAQASDVTV